MRPLLVLIALTALVSPALADEPSKPGTISISGKGEVTAAPDTAFITSGVTTDAKTAREALTANTRAMSDLIAALKEAAIDAKDIQTSGFSVAPQYVYANKPDANGYTPPPAISGYQVQNSVSVRVRKIAGLGDVLDKMVTVGANTIGGISFSVDDPAKLLDGARKAAFADAKAKASVYTEAAGIDLGRIVSISEGEDNPPAPRPMMMKAMASDAAAPVPVEAGQLTYDVNVAVEWELKTSPAN